MDLTAAINGLLDAFGSRHGLTGLSLNAEGVAALCFDDTLRLSLILMPQWDQLVLQLDIAPLHQVGEGIFRQLATFNRHWYQFDLHFGFDEELNMIQMYRRLTASSLTLETFEARVASLLDHAEFWRSLLEEEESNPLDAPAVAVRV